MFPRFLVPDRHRVSWWLRLSSKLRYLPISVAASQRRGTRMSWVLTPHDAHSAVANIDQLSLTCEKSCAAPKSSCPLPLFGPNRQFVCDRQLCAKPTTSSTSAATTPAPHCQPVPLRLAVSPLAPSSHLSPSPPPRRQTGGHCVS
jgi:hypothetical protein